MKLLVLYFLSGAATTCKRRYCTPAVTPVPNCYYFWSHFEKNSHISTLGVPNGQRINGFPFSRKTKFPKSWVQLKTYRWLFQSLQRLLEYWLGASFLPGYSCFNFISKLFKVSCFSPSPVTLSSVIWMNSQKTNFAHSIVRYHVDAANNLNHAKLHNDYQFQKIKDYLFVLS